MCYPVNGGFGSVSYSRHKHRVRSTESSTVTNSLLSKLNKQERNRRPINMMSPNDSPINYSTTDRVNEPDTNRVKNTEIDLINI